MVALLQDKDLGVAVFAMKTLDRFIEDSTDFYDDEADEDEETHDKPEEESGWFRRRSFAVLNSLRRSLERGAQPRAAGVGGSAAAAERDARSRHARRCHADLLARRASAR